MVKKTPTKAAKKVKAKPKPKAKAKAKGKAKGAKRGKKGKWWLFSLLILDIRYKKSSWGEVSSN